MKNHYFICLIIVFNSIIIFAQRTDQENATLIYVNYMVTKTGNNPLTYVNPPKKIKGSYHLFKDWNNTGIIKTSNNKVYKIKNINFNIKDNRHELKIGKDSVFILDLENIDYITINYRKLKSFYISDNGSYKIVEVIVENNMFSLLKEYKSDIKINDPHPLMLEPHYDEYFIKSSYYIKRGDNVEKFKLNKKSIYGLISKGNIKKLEKYVRENKLSYKKDKDVNKMLSYILKI